MPLIGNRSVLNKSPGRFLNAGVATLRSEFNKHGMQRNAFEAFDGKSATPVGHLAPSAWVMPKTAGGMSSINSAGVTILPTALAVGGVTATAEATLTITFSDATAQLISSGDGSATISILSNSPTLTASIGGVGSAVLSITTNTPVLGAEVSGSGTASVSIFGTLTPYAIGQMVGSTVDNGALTADSITAAVWNAVLADFNTNGSAGKALATAGVGGVDLEALASAVWAHVSRTLTEGGGGGVGYDLTFVTGPTSADIATAVAGHPETLTVPKFIALK